MWAGAGVPVTSVDIIPVTRDGVSAATVGLRTSGTGQHWSRHRTQTSVISKQPPESGGHQSGKGCAVTLVRTVEASIKTLWLRIRINKEVFISSNPENLIAATFY